MQMLIGVITIVAVFFGLFFLLMFLYSGGSQDRHVDDSDPRPRTRY